MQFNFSVSANLIKFLPSTNLNLKSNKAVNENSINFHNIYENNRFSVKHCSHVLQFKVFWDYESTITKRIRRSSFITFLQKFVTAFNFSLIFLEITSCWRFCRFAEQWWRSGESTRLPPMWPGFDFRLGVICGLSVLVLESALRGLSRVLRFSLLLKKKKKKKNPRSKKLEKNKIKL